MGYKQTAIALSLTALGLILGNSAAEAFTLNRYTQTEFEALGLNLPWQWTAESRIGRVGDHQVNIHDSTNSHLNREQANYDWVSGQAVDFSLTFDSVAKTLTYIVGDVELSKTNLGVSSFSDLLIRTVAYEYDSRMALMGLSLTDEQGSGRLGWTFNQGCRWGQNCDTTPKYLHISDIVGSFTLTGQSVMSWKDCAIPVNSELAYQLKLSGEKVPEPMGISLFSLALLGFLVKGKPKNKE
ncbi:PEP-CTERM sorting domain-containing protein [Spirulina subsalsa FACHB-351]|uniref:PEP-CTERM sorting domain-containing protein n=1 Tax=Spirulina subsalsa FACHB-351 TaxID=234711 RepID=A0ABT3LB15_9CYAN|nr:choice-of-anchor W domain-containing protein [Spirulina subsalsa]MCW6038705.1 PEP-CTERM sorting domain-containing protein [Spirulina subsalsa FACHB-351]